MKIVSNISGLSKVAQQAQAAMNDALDDLKAERARTGETMVVWRDGRVCHIHPEAPAAVRESSPGYKVSRPRR